MGLFKAADVDAAIGPALRVRFRTGDFDPAASRPVQGDPSDRDAVGTDEARARGAGRDAPDGRAAQERERHAAPRRTARSPVAVIGPRADSVVRDWYGGTPPYHGHRSPGESRRSSPEPASR